MIGGFDFWAGGAVVVVGLLVGLVIGLGAGWIAGFNRLKGLVEKQEQLIELLLALLRLERFGRGHRVD